MERGQNDASKVLRACTLLAVAVASVFAAACGGGTPAKIARRYRAAAGPNVGAFEWDGTLPEPGEQTVQQWLTRIAPRL